MMSFLPSMIILERYCLERLQSMKLHLLHGAAKAASRKKLTEIKQKFDPNNILVFEEGADFKQIKDNLAASSIFPTNRLVVLENPDEKIAFDNLDSSDYLTLVLWFDHEVNTRKWVDAEILFFPEGRETSVFPLLDLLAADNTKAFLEIKKLKMAGFDLYYIMTMVFYLLRNLVASPKNAPDFVKQKLMRQRKNFNLERLIFLYKEVLQIDFKLKSGLIEVEQA